MTLTSLNGTDKQNKKTVAIKERKKRKKAKEKGRKENKRK